VKDINAKMDELLVNIKQMQQDAADKLQNNRAKIWIMLDENLAKYKAELSAENQNKKGDDFDF
jgi:dTDP-4-amino-4,6-dideoxygalactose transaminase